MNKFLLILYSIFLFLYSLVIVVFILAGSHGRLLLNNPETLQGLTVILVFVSTGVMLLYHLRNPITVKLKFTLLVTLIGVSVAIMTYLLSIFYPDNFDVYSTSFFLWQILVVSLGLLVLFKELLLKKKRERMISSK
jgi:hypothetical protein